MANSKILTAEQEKTLRQPIEEYVGKIQKEIDPVSGKPYLILFPEDSRKFNGCSEDRERMAEERNVTFDHEYQMQEFMKEIILNGVVDLEDYS